MARAKLKPDSNLPTKSKEVAKLNSSPNFERQRPNNKSNKIFVFHFHKGNSKVISYTGSWHKEKHFHSSALAGPYPACSFPFWALFLWAMLDFCASVFQHPANPYTYHHQQPREKKSTTTNFWKYIKE